MPENARFSGGLDGIHLGFVEREATPRLLMEVGIQLHLAGFSLSSSIAVLIYSALVEFDRPSTTGFTKPSYSPKMVDRRTT